MTWFPYVEFNPNQGFIDAFGRQRVSQPESLFDSKQIFDNQPLFWDDQEVSGGGTGSTHSTDTASSTMTVSNTTAGNRVRQTFRRFNYQTAKSQLIFLTGVFGAGATGITKRIGYFDDENGLFFELDGTTLNVVRRTFVTGSAVDNQVAQASWNLDIMDGSGESGITLDLTKTQIMVIDFEWLGVGRVRMGWVIDGGIFYCHHFLNTNVLADVYMSTPNLPLRYELDNDGTGAADSLEHICTSVSSEGGRQLIGPTRHVTRGTTVFTTANDTNLYPIISIRLKSTHLAQTTIPESFSVVCTSTADFEVVLIVNPTVAGVDAVSWVNETNSSLQYDISRDNTNTLSGGTMIDGAMGSSTNQGRVPVSSDVAQSLLIGSDISGTQDELVLAVRNLTAGAENYYASINMRELT